MSENYFTLEASDNTVKWKIGDTEETINTAASILSPGALQIFWLRGCDDVVCGRCGIFPLTISTHQPSFFLVGELYSSDSVVFNQTLNDQTLLTTSSKYSSIKPKFKNDEGENISAFITTKSSIQRFQTTLANQISL